MENSKTHHQVRNGLVIRSSVLDHSDIVDYIFKTCGLFYNRMPSLALTVVVVLDFRTMQFTFPDVGIG